VNLTAGEYDLTLEVSEAAEISLIQSEILDTSPAELLKVTASSGKAENAFDRRNSTIWTPDSEDEAPALTLDFEGEEIYADHFMINGSFRGISGYKVKTSNDGSNWEEVYTSSSAPENGIKVYIQSVEAIKASQWRFEFTGDTQWLSINEIQLNTYINWAIQDTNPQFVDTVQGSTLSQSSPLKIIDGNRIGRPKVANIWAVQSASEVATLQFAEPHLLTGIYVSGIQDEVENNGTDPNAGVNPNDILTSSRISSTYDASYQGTDGQWSAWKTYQTGSKVLFYIDFGATVEATAVRLRVPTSTTGGYVRIMEMEPVELRKYAAVPEKEIFVIYRAGTGGTIVGDTEQSFMQAGQTTEVRAEASEGYRFVQWDDGNTSPSRTDSVTEDKIFTAVFESITGESPSPSGAPEESASPSGAPIESASPSGAPIESSKPISSQTPKPTSANQTTIPARGSIIKVGNFRYRITKSTPKNKTAVFVSPTKKTLTKAVVPNTIKVNRSSFKVTSIAAKAFYKNNKLTSITIGKNITSIGANAMAYCKKLKSVQIQSKKLKSIGKGAFKKIHKKAKMKVPAGKKKAYKKILKRAGFKNI
jgi:hypothetical protein